LDNGLFPFLAVLDMLSKENKTFSEVLKPMREKFFVSEEINFKVQTENILEELKQSYKDAEVDSTDGYSFNYPDWRFNVRKSNTENLLRINIEADSEKLLEEKTKEVSLLIEKLG
jgi:phosphomannomutase